MVKPRREGSRKKLSKPARPKAEPPFLRGTDDRPFTDRENAEMKRISDERKKTVNSLAMEVGLFLFEFRRLEETVDYANGILLTMRNYDSMVRLGLALSMHQKIALMFSSIQSSKMENKLKRFLKGDADALAKLRNERDRFAHGRLINPSYKVYEDRMERERGWRVEFMKLSHSPNKIISDDTPETIRGLRFKCISLSNQIHLHIEEYVSWKSKRLALLQEEQKHFP